MKNPLSTLRQYWQHLNRPPLPYVDPQTVHDFCLNLDELDGVRDKSTTSFAEWQAYTRVLQEGFEEISPEMIQLILKWREEAKQKCLERIAFMKIETDPMRHALGE